MRVATMFLACRPFKPGRHEASFEIGVIPMGDLDLGRALAAVEHVQHLRFRIFGWYREYGDIRDGFRDRRWRHGHHWNNDRFHLGQFLYHRFRNGQNLLRFFRLDYAVGLFLGQGDLGRLFCLNRFFCRNGSGLFLGNGSDRIIEYFVDSQFDGQANRQEFVAADRLGSLLDLPVKPRRNIDKTVRGAF
jgi:hypothetical protein